MKDRRMKLVFFGNDFPSDDLNDVFRRLQIHSKDKKHLHLAAFLDEATFALRDEIRGLPDGLRKLIPHFESVLDLVNFSDLRKGPLGQVIEGVLLCVLELAIFIGYVMSS
jgi:hypothetical protein